MGKFDGVLDEIYGKQNTKLTSVLDEIYGPEVEPVTMVENEPTPIADMMVGLNRGIESAGEAITSPIQKLFTAPPNQDVVVPEELDMCSMQAVRDRQAMIPPKAPAEPGYVPPAGITEGLEAALPIAYQATKKGISGAVQALAENAPVTSFPTAPIVEYMQGVGKGAQAEIEKIMQEKQIRPGTVGGVATDVASSMAQFLPIAGMSIISPSVAPAGLAFLATVSGGDKYQRAKEAGFGEGEALAQGIAYGAAEAIGEKIGLDYLLAAAKNPAVMSGVKTIFAQGLKQAGVEGAEEGLTQIIQNATDIVAKKARPETKGEAPTILQDVPYAMGVGTLAGGLTGGGLGALQSVIGGQQQAEAPIEKPVDTQMTEFLKKQNDTRDNVRTIADVEKQMQEAEALRKISDEYNQLMRDEAKGKPTGEEIKRQRVEQMKSQAGFAEETQIDDTEAVIREAQKAATQAQQADARQRKANVLEGLFGQQEPQPMEGGRSLPYPKNDVIQEIRDAGLKTKNEVVAFFSGRHNITREGASNLLKIAYNQPLPERTHKTPPSKPPAQPPTTDQLFTRKPAVTVGEAERLQGEDVPTGGMTIGPRRPAVTFGGEGERTGEAIPESKGMTVQPTAPTNKLDQLFKLEEQESKPTVSTKEQKTMDKLFKSGNIEEKAKADVVGAKMAEELNREEITKQKYSYAKTSGLKNGYAVIHSLIKGDYPQVIADINAGRTNILDVETALNNLTKIDPLSKENNNYFLDKIKSSKTSPERQQAPEVVAEDIKPQPAEPTAVKTPEIEPRPKSGLGMFEGAELQNEEIDWSAPFSRVIIDENDARFIERFKQKGIDINLAKISGSIEKMPKELLTKLAEGYDMGSNAVEALYRYVKGEQKPEIIKYFNDKGEEIQHNPNGWNEIILTITNDGHSISNTPQKGTKAREVIDKILKEHYEKRELDIMQNIAGETTIGTLKDWLKGPNATEMFKDVLDTQVIIRPEGPTNTTLAWVPSDGEAIYLNSSQIKTVGIRYLKNAITHEAQHLLQIKKGQKIGGQNYLPYKERPAEIEAHAVGEKYRTGRLSMFGAGTLQNVYESVFGKPRQSDNRMTIGDPKIGTKINDMYDRTEATRKNLDEQAEKKRPSTYATTKQSMIDVFMPYLDIVKNDSARYEQALSKLHDVFYIPSAVEGFLLDLRDEILTPVQKAGKTYRDYSAYRMAKWTLTGRAKVKSPLSLKEAQDFIDSIDAPTKKLFEDITTKFHERVWKNVLKEVESTGLKDDKTINFIMDKENYATFFPAKQMGLSYGSREYKPSGEIFKLTEEGYTGDIQDVLTSLTQKGIAMLTHANINAAKLEAFDILKTYSPNDITPAKQSMKGYTKIKDSNGNEIEIPIMEFDEPAPNSQMALLTARDKGKAVGYYVPKQFATSFDEALGSGEQLHDALRYFSNATQAIKNVWIDYNPPWQLFTNMIRDIPAAMIEMPGFKKPVKFAGKVIRNAPAAIGDYIPVIGKALQIMTGYDRAKFDAQVKKMLKEKKLLSSKDVQQLGDYNISVFDRIQNAFDTFPREGESKKFLQQVKAFGKDVERLVKTAFDETLVESQEFTDDEIVNMTRRGGSPAFAVRGGGKAFNVATTALVFYNAVKEGWRAGKYFYEKDPVGFVIKASIPLSIFSFGVAAVSGAFGDEWKKAYLAIKKSDRENKLTFPLWWEPDGQIKYIALSMPQFLKPFMTAINEFGSADARILEGMADAFSNEMPSLNPVFDIAKTLALYGQNKPPIDRFGNPIMTQDQWTAGGPDKAINMLKAISNQNLFGSIYRFPIKPSETKKDLFSLTSLYDATFGKILKTSFAPAMDTEKEEANAAKARLLMREAIEIEKSDPVKYQKLRDEIRKLGVIPSRQFMRSVRRSLNIEREEKAGMITKREAYEKKLRGQLKEKRKKYNELFRK